MSSRFVRDATSPGIGSRNLFPPRPAAVSFVEVDLRKPSHHGGKIAAKEEPEVARCCAASRPSGSMVRINDGNRAELSGPDPLARFRFDHRRMGTAVSVQETPRTFGVFTAEGT